MTPPRRPATEAEAAALASGIRLRIIRLTHSEALTNKELAERLGRDPATTLHHVRKLVDTGFLTPQPSRRGNRGAKEIPYLSTGLSWQLTGVSLYEGVGKAVLEAYLAEIAEINEGELSQTRLVTWLSEPERHELEDRVRELFEEYRSRAEPGTGERTAIYFATYPSR